MRMHHDAIGSGVLDDRFGPGDGVPWIDRDVSRAGPEDREKCDDQIRRTLQIDEHPRTGANTAFGEARRKRPRRAVDLPVRQGPEAVGDGDRVRRDRGAPFDELVDRHGRLRRGERGVCLLEDRGALVVRDDREPSERRTGTGQRVREQCGVMAEQTARGAGVEEIGGELDAGGLPELGNEEPELAAQRARVRRSQLEPGRRRFPRVRRTAMLECDFDERRVRCP